MTLSVRLQHGFPGFALDVAFSAPDGVTALFGRSGSGKTTVVNAVAGLLQPRAGRIVLGEKVLFDSAEGIGVPTHRRRLGYVFQDARLFPHLTVRQNLGYGRWFAGSKAPGDEARIVELLGLGALLHRRPAALSGGERQRVAIGRALLAAPALLLMDEPLAALDEARKAEILPFLERLRDDARVPILYVSHSVAEVARLATTLVVLERGRVAHAGPAAEILADPAAVPAIGRREAGAVIRGRVLAHAADGLSELAVSGGTLAVPGIQAPVGAMLRLRIHAQDVILSRTRPEGLSALNILPAVVTAVRIGGGPGAVVGLRAGEDRLLARITRRSAEAMALAPGDPCFAILKSVAIAQGDIGSD